jgi:hypothetical protein
MVTTREVLCPAFLVGWIPDSRDKGPMDGYERMVYETTKSGCQSGRLSCFLADSLFSSWAGAFSGDLMDSESFDAANHDNQY